MLLKFPVLLLVTLLTIVLLAGVAAPEPLARSGRSLARHSHHDGHGRPSGPSFPSRGDRAFFRQFPRQSIVDILGIHRDGFDRFRQDIRDPHFRLQFVHDARDRLDHCDLTPFRQHFGWPDSIDQGTERRLLRESLDDFLEEACDDPDVLRSYLLG